jgi:acyl dehydratase
LLHFEDFAPGSVAEYGPRIVTREEIFAFAAEFDPQPMHLDEAAGRAGMLGGQVASGWHVACLMMRIIVDGFLLRSTSMGSPGVEETRWLAPLRPGDRVRVRAIVLDTRASGTRPHMGFVKFRLEMRNQHDTVLMTLITHLMLARRPT